MNKAKLINVDLYSGIDTIEVRTDNEIEPTGAADFVPTSSRVNNQKSTYFYKLNPDKGFGAAVYNSHDYYDTRDYMFDYLNMSNPVVTRIDYRFDCFDDNFNDLLKLNKLLIMLIAEQYKVNNHYESRDFMTLQELTVRIQNDRIEVENYNKAIEEPGGDVRNRLEFRSKKLYDSTAENNKEEREFRKWCNRLDKSVTADNFNCLQKKLTDILANEYEKVRTEGVSTSQFLYKFESSIFTSRQLREFYSQLGYKDPAQCAKRYKQRRRIEYFSLKNIRDYVDKIKESGAVFFGSGK